MGSLDIFSEILPPLFKFGTFPSGPFLAEAAADFWIRSRTVFRVLSGRLDRPVLAESFLMIDWFMDTSNSLIPETAAVRPTPALRLGDLPEAASSAPDFVVLFVLITPLFPAVLSSMENLL